MYSSSTVNNKTEKMTKIVTMRSMPLKKDAHNFMMLQCNVITDSYEVLENMDI